MDNMNDEEKITPEGCRYKIIRNIEKWRKENQPPKNKCGTKEYFKEYYYERGGREIFSKAFAKRHRNLKWIPLFLNPFPSEIKSEYHHINNILVIPLPFVLHSKTNKKPIQKHRKQCEEIIKNIYNLDINNLLNL
jgi:hypothetical protein